MSEAGYRGPQVCKLVGITYRQLDHWTRTELICPSIAEAKGSGSQRLYSYRDLVELKVIKKMLDGGLSLQSVRKVVGYLRDQMDVEIGSAHLVMDGSRTVLARSGEELIDLLKAGQGVLNVVALSNVKSELEAAIVSLRIEQGEDVATSDTRTSAPPTELGRAAGG